MTSPTPSPTTTLAVANQKGGVAKTTSVASLGAALAELGHSVLLVDLDPQACLTFSLGIDPEDVEMSIHHVLTKGMHASEVVIETDDGATLLLESHGFGRAYPAGARQIVGSMLHVTDHPRYRRLNDVVCVCAGEVRSSGDAVSGSPDLVLDVAELIWEPIGP